jgi:hypothetical protein
MDGAGLVEMNMLFKCFFANHTAPKYVVVDLSSGAFDINEAAIFNPNIYYPFLSNPTVFESLSPYKRVGLLKYFPFLQITEWDETLRQGAVKGIFGRKMRVAPHHKGYLESGNDTIRLPFKKTYLKTLFPVMARGKQLLEEIIRICHDHDAQVVVTYSPIYKMKDEKLNPEFFSTVQQICDANQVTFLNYRNLVSDDHTLFRDEHHLNKTGAQLFTRRLSHDLLNLWAADGDKDKHL